jgi:hypothetical protein
MDDYERAAANDYQSRTPTVVAGRSRPTHLERLHRLPAFESQLAALLFGTNLTDEWYVNGGIDVGLYQGYDFGTIGRPREVGLGAQIVFD